MRCSMKQMTGFSKKKKINEKKGGGRESDI